LTENLLPSHVHIVGIGGSACSGLARLLMERGCKISGSDSRGGEIIAELNAVGATVFKGHDRNNLPAEVELLIHSAAVPTENPELLEAKERGIEIIKYAGFLGRLLDDSFGIAVAGTHGKTTTSGMLVSILLAAGKDPTVLVGGNHPDLGGGRNWRAGTAEEMIVEACEFDRSFHSLRPKAAVVLNVDHDHVDTYPHLSDVYESFARFIAGVAPGGPVVIWADDPFLDFLPPEAKRDLDVRTFGFTNEAHYRAKLVDSIPAPRFRVYKKNETEGEEKFWGEVTLNDKVHGDYSVLDALAALTLADAIGIPSKEVIKGLADFPGMSRRFECREVLDNVQWIDDYAHHPTELKAVLKSAKELYQDRTVWVLFQPHQYIRLETLFNDFASALELADRIALLPLFSVREPVALEGEDLVGKLKHELEIKRGKPKVERFDSLEDCAARFPGFLQPGNVVMACGAGDLIEVGGMLHGEVAGGKPLIPSIPGCVREYVDLSSHCTYRTGGPARWLGEPTSLQEFRDLDCWARGEEIRRFYLGGGSNTLFPDEGFEGLVVLTRHLDGISFPADGIIEAEAGAALIKVIRLANDRGWQGLEEFVGIPGTIGGAVWGNAGASAGGIGQVVDAIEVVTDSGEVEWLPASSESLDWRYRHSGIGERAIVRVRLRLSPGADLRELKSISQKLQEYKQQTQPLSAWSCGCVFRNPSGDTSAGALIEWAGLMGKRLGGALVSVKHANFIINEGGATSGEIVALIAEVRDRVEDFHGIRLIHEVITPEKAGGSRRW